MQIARNIVKPVAVGLQVLGGAAAVVGALNDIDKYNHGEISGAHLTVNLIMNGVGIFLGPYGAAISIAYGLTEKWWWNE